MSVLAHTPAYSLGQQPVRQELLVALSRRLGRVVTPDEVVRVSGPHDTPSGPRWIVEGLSPLLDEPGVGYIVQGVYESEAEALAHRDRIV